MSRKKLKHSKDKCSSLLAKCPSLKSSLLAYETNDEVMSKLRDALVGKSSGVNKVIGAFRNIISEIMCNSLQNNQFEVIMSVAISVIEHKQMRQIAIKLLVALAQGYPHDFNQCLRARTYLTSESLMFMMLYCSECVKYLKLDVLKCLWEEQFSDELDTNTIADNKFIFACRAFNAYIGAIEKFHDNVKDIESIVDQKTFGTIISFATNKSFNRDCRQVLGLICLTMKTIATNSHHQSYTELMNQSYTLKETAASDFDFYRFCLSAGMVSKVREFTGDREILYERVINHVVSLTQRIDMDKQFTISVFKTVNLFLQTVLRMGEEARVHVYPEEEGRCDPLGVDKRRLHPDSELTTRLLALVQIHWSNKLEAVRRTVCEIHSNLIQVTTVLSGQEAAQSFLNNQVKGLLSLSWEVHGKYLALSQLVPIIGTSAILQIEPDLPHTILTTLSTEQGVAAHCAALYYTLYKHDETLHSQNVWLAPITQFLDNPFLCDLCLRPILEFDEGSLYYLRDHLNAQNRTEELVRVLREGRRLGFLDFKFTDEPELYTDDHGTLFDIPTHKIKVLCDSNDDCKVLSVMSLICDTNKTALPMAYTELDLMMYIIKNNQIRQVPSFRKNMFDNIEKFLARLNNSCPILSKLVKNRYTEEDEYVSDKASEMLENYSEFMENCIEMCYKELIPSASFQRQVTVIGILEKFYSNLTSCNFGNLTKISGPHLDKLINTLGSPFENVRNSSLSCISTFKDIPKECFVSNMRRVLASLTSPKGVSSQKHCTLFSFILAKSVGDPGFPPIDIIQEDYLYSSSFTSDILEDHSVLFQWITGLFSIIDHQIKKACVGLMEAARLHPIFPAFNLLDVALRESGVLKDDLTPSEQMTVVAKLLEYSQQLSTLLREPIVDESPEGLLLMGSIESGGGSCGPQLLLSMTWRTMQSVCSCLVTMVTSSITSPQDDLNIGLYLKNLLLTVRHHGVFENVHSAFITYCYTMWDRKKGVLLTWLDEVLCRVETSENDMSYTRRSAGIPSLIQAILVTESGRNGKPHFRSCMERLLNLSEHPTLITGRIHALNILHTLFKDSKLAEFVVPFIGRAFEISVRGFSEQLWSLRNASTMIFTVLMTRLFNSRHNNPKQTTDATFFTLFSNLHPYFMGELSKATRDEKCLYYPSLYPTLLILQRLTPCPMSAGDPHLSLSHFIGVIEKLSLSGVLKTRSLAAETLSSIIPVPDIQDFVLGQIRKLERSMKQNRVHGTLLQVRHGLKKCSDHRAVLLELVDKSWLLTDNVCPFTSSAYVELLSRAVDTADDPPDLTALIHKAMSVIRTCYKLGPVSTLKEACAHFIMSLKSSALTGEMVLLNDSAVCEIVFETAGIGTWFRMRAEDVVDVTEWGLSATLHLLQTGCGDDIFTEKIYHQILGVLERNPNPQTQTKALEVLTHISNVPSPEHATRIIDPLCSSLNPWEQRLLIPGCLENVYRSIPSSTTDSIPLQSRVLWCLVSLLQDDDDGVRRNAAAVILDITLYQHKDTAPELVLPLLLSHLLSVSPHWTLPLLQWIHQSEIQDLMTSHYFEQYKSEGYAATTRQAHTTHRGEDAVLCIAPHSSHPLFEPDLVNSFAEPLCIPLAVLESLKDLETDYVGDKGLALCQDKGLASESLCHDLRELSRSVFQEFKEKLSHRSCNDTTVRDFVLQSKVDIFTESILKIALLFNISLDHEDWNSLIA